MKMCFKLVGNYIERIYGWIEWCYFIYPLGKEVGVGINNNTDQEGFDKGSRANHII